MVAFQLVDTITAEADKVTWAKPIKTQEMACVEYSNRKTILINETSIVHLRFELFWLREFFGTEKKCDYSLLNGSGCELYSIRSKYMLDNIQHYSTGTAPMGDNLKLKQLHYSKCPT